MKTIRVWRISHRNYRDTAFSGEGARLYGGRFNSEGLAAVYTSGSLSLALLEMLVQTNSRSHFEACAVFYADIPGSLISAPAEDQFPEGWDRVPYGPSSQNFGDRWIHMQKRPVLKIPSVVVPVEYNYVLDPTHPDFGRIIISEPTQVGFDRRLFAV